MRIIVIAVVGYLIASCPVLLAQPSSAMATFQGDGGAAAIVNSAVISFSERVGRSDLYPIFDTLSLSTNDVGHLFTYTQLNDPDFNSMVNILTDGISESVGYSITLPGGDSQGQWTSESHFFSQLPIGGNGVDFQGFQIDSISLRLDQLSFASPGSNPNGNGIWTDYSFKADIFVNYEPEPVPEPTTMALLSIFGLMFGVFRRLQGRRKTLDAA